jgi:exodeoxyribonuclease V alpha subunit
LVRNLLGLSGEYVPGTPLLIARNDSRTELYNGDVGLVVSDPAKPGGVRIRFPNRTRGFLPAELPEHEVVYAMTVHKSQGSGFRNVLFVLPDEPAAVLTRELIYTAITRAERRVELWGSEAVLAEALRRKTVRLSGLADRLRSS